MKCGFSVNTYKQNAKNVATKFADLLVNEGIEVLFDEIFVPESYTGCAPENLADKCDVVLVFGGDGTVLRVAGVCAKANTPILALNFGKLGFLADFGENDLDKILELLKNRKFMVEKRSMLEVCVDDKNYLALNEVVISRGINSKILNIEVLLDESLVDKYFADGVVVSTPTGSTAYNLSSGGPILSPDVDANVITPICSHSLHTRPIVYADKHEVKIKVSKSYNGAFMSVDGREAVLIKDNGEVKISKSNHSALFVKQNNVTFVGRLLEKLNTWSITEKENL